MHLFALTFLALNLLSSSAQAGDFTPTAPQLRLGLHASDDSTLAHQPVIHLMFPDMLADPKAALYAGWHLPLNDYWSLETLAGVTLQPDPNSPIVSFRAERTHRLVYVWADLEYTPLLHHNLYGYLRVACMVGAFKLGVDTENWVNLVRASGQPHQYSLSVGPSVSVSVGHHVILEEALLWTGHELIPRTAFQLGF